jgi:hypothetical protein
MQDDLAEKLKAALAVVRRAVAQIEALPRDLARAPSGLSPGGMARELLLERHRREEQFPTPLFGEPGWELMLALYIAREEGRSLSLAEAWAAARIKPAAGRRLIETMQADALLAMVDGGRGRRHVRLTDAAAERMSDYLLACFGHRVSG